MICQLPSVKVRCAVCENNSLMQQRKTVESTARVSQSRRVTSGRHIAALIARLRDFIYRCYSCSNSPERTAREPCMLMSKGMRIFETSNISRGVFAIRSGSQRTFTVRVIRRFRMFKIYESWTNKC